MAPLVRRGLRFEPVERIRAREPQLQEM